MEIKYIKILTVFIIITCGCYSKSTEKLPTEKIKLRYNPKGTFTRVGEHPMTEFMEFSSRDRKTSLIVIPSFEHQNPNKAFIVFYDERTVSKGFGVALISGEAKGPVLETFTDMQCLAYSADYMCDARKVVLSSYKTDTGLIITFEKLEHMIRIKIKENNQISEYYLARVYYDNECMPDGIYRTSMTTCELDFYNWD